MPGCPVAAPMRILSVMHEPADKPPDRRTSRTRSAIMLAFNRLILESGYASLTPARIAAAADVGRSTFYEHFRGIDDLLAQSLKTVFSPLTSGCSENEPSEAAFRAVRHFWENRQLARVLFGGAGYVIALKSCAVQFEAALEELIKSSKSKPTLEPELIAIQLAAGQLALLNAWISGRYGHSPQRDHPGPAYKFPRPSPRVFDCAIEHGRLRKCERQQLMPR